MRWNAVPFLFLTPSLIIGIMIQEVYVTGENPHFWPVLFLALFSSIYFCLKFFYKYYLKYAILPLLFISFILIGFLSSHYNWQLSDPQISEDSLSQVTQFTVRIDSKSTETVKTFRYEVYIDKIKIGDSWIPLDRKAILYALDKGKFDYGQMIMINGNPVILKRQTNPHAFDYTLFLQRKGIFLATYVNEQNYRVLEEDYSDSFRYLALSIGDIFEGILSKYITSEPGINMIKAMVIGRKNDITPEMEYAYEATGTSHILAVSGLHVGIIYLVISHIFGFAKRKKWKRMYYTIILFSIWSFALITGFSPSVRRAALMFSFFVIAEMIHRKSNIYNTLLASAFCILLFSPNLLFSVSFQFSYVAVLGIVFLYNRIYTLIYVKNTVLNFFWQITALSFSVQLATFAINIHYFHHFPTLFPLTNLLAIPTAMIVVVGSLLVFTFSIIPFAAEILGFILEKWVNFYNNSMLFLSKFSITSIENIYLKSIYVYAIVLMLFLLILFIESRRIRYFKIFTLCLLLTTVLIFVDRYRCTYQQKLFIYDVNEKPYMDAFIGNTCYSNVKTDNSNPDIEYNLMPNRRHHLISEVKSMNNFPKCRSIDKNMILLMNDKSFLLMDNPITLSMTNRPIEIDYLILGKSTLNYLDKILKVVSAKNLILHGTWNQDHIKMLQRKKSPKSSMHIIELDGAFKYSI